MKKQELIGSIATFLKENGIDKTALLISDAIDQAGPVTGNSINYNHREIAKELTKIPSLRQYS